MVEDVAVTNVIVEYAFGGKAFKVVFANPSEIRAIIFNREDLERLKAKQGEATNKAVIEHRLDPLSPIGLTADGDATHAVGTQTGTNDTVAPALMGLWWHTSACTFFHPEKL